MLGHRAGQQPSFIQLAQQVFGDGALARREREFAALAQKGKQRRCRLLDPFCRVDFIFAPHSAPVALAEPAVPCQAARSAAASFERPAAPRAHGSSLDIQHRVGVTMLDEILGESGGRKAQDRHQPDLVDRQQFDAVRKAEAGAECSHGAIRFFNYCLCAITAQALSFVK
jgi:hypothetical protein